MAWLVLQIAVAGLEICDGIDNDGDGSIDEAPILVFTDVDGDGAGDPSSYTVSTDPCSTIDAAPPTDCDDADPDAWPGNDEACDGRDQDCDGAVDEQSCQPCQHELFEDTTYLRCGQPLPRRSWEDAVTWCLDTGYLPAVPDDASEQSFLNSISANRDRWVGLQDTDGDGAWLTWDDLVPFGPQWSPGEPLVEPGCALVEQGGASDGLSTAACDTDQGWLCEITCTPRTWYADADGDGQGAGPAVSSCIAPGGHVAVPGDCDDGDPARHATATEVCNGVDDDCDGVIDNGGDTGASTWYPDADSDGIGDASAPLVTCSPPAGHVEVPGDCDDDDPAVGGPVSQPIDDDGDGFAGPQTAITCVTVLATGDCDDLDASVFPGASERCNERDDDCDGTVDEDAIDATAWYPNTDGDGYGGGSPVLACAQPAGFIATGGDCDDDRADVSPDAIEVCNGRDDDCDGTTDVGSTDASTFYADADGDGVGADPIEACALPSEASERSGDCDDTEATVFPGAEEIGDDGVDQDCDGTDLVYVYGNGMDCGCQSTTARWPRLLRR